MLYIETNEMYKGHWIQERTDLSRSVNKCILLSVHTLDVFFLQKRVNRNLDV